MDYRVSKIARDGTVFATGRWGETKIGRVFKHPRRDGPVGNNHVRWGYSIAAFGFAEKQENYTTRAIAASWLVKTFDALATEEVTRKNLLSGKEYTERRDTPPYCSPSCNSYWEF